LSGLASGSLTYIRGSKIGKTYSQSPECVRKLGSSCEGVQGLVLFSHLVAVGSRVVCVSRQIFPPFLSVDRPIMPSSIIKHDWASIDANNAQPEPADSAARPPVVYNSPQAFVSSLWRRFRSLWTRRFTLSLLAGQVVSLCITCTTVTTTELVSRNWSLPTTQTFFL
jgi:hypothetical protein